MRKRHIKERGAAAGFNRKRRLLSTLLAVVLLMSLPTRVAAADSYENATGGGRGAYPSATLIRSNDHEKYMDGYADGSFRPDSPVSRAELAQMLAKVVTDTAPVTVRFSDVPQDAWFAPAVQQVAGLGLMAGECGVFRPDEPVTRAECAYALAQLLPGDAPLADAFSDVWPGHWAYQAICRTAGQGLFYGDNAGNFRPNDSLTRCETAAVFNRLLGRSPDLQALAAQTNLRTFPDVPRSHWAYGEIMEATVSHVNVPSQGGQETWDEVAAEGTALVDGYHAIGGYVYYIADGAIFCGSAGEDRADPNGFPLVYDESGRARAALSDGLYVMNGLVYRVKDGMFLYDTSDGYLTYDANGQAAFTHGPVQLILQKPELPNGCEVTSLAMVLDSTGHPVDKLTLYQDYLPKENVSYQGARRYGPNPEEYYVGNAASQSGGWYCFEGPVVQAANDWLADSGSDIQAFSIRGLSQDELDAYAKAGIPVIAWVTVNYAAPRRSGSSWRLADGTVYHPYSNLHCVVLTGVSEGRYQIADPINGLCTVSRTAFWNSFSAMGGRAVVLA